MKDHVVPLWHWLLSAGLLFLVTFLVWAPAIEHRTTMDAEFFLVKDDRVAEGDLGKIFSTDWWDNKDDGSRLEDQAGLYRPVALAWLSMLFEPLPEKDFREFVQTGVNRGNVFLHALATVLRFLLIAFILGRTRSAWLAGLSLGILLGVHPVAVETVGTGVGAAEGLAAVFGTGALLLAFAPARWPRAVVGMAILLLALLSMLSKENLIVLPAIAILQLWWTRDGGLVAALKASWPYVLAAVIALALRAAILGGIASVGDPVLALFPFGPRLATALAVIGTYVLRVLFWPTGFNPLLSLQDVPPAESIADPRALTGLCFLLLLLAGFIVGWERHRKLGLGFAFFGLAFLPVSNLIVPIGALSATRFLYFPIFGLGLVLAVAACWIVRNPTRPRVLVLAALTLVLAVPLTISSRHELKSWESSNALFEAAVEDWPQSAILRHKLGVTLADRVGVSEAKGESPASLGEQYARILAEIEAAYALPLPTIPGTDGHKQEDLIETRYELAMNATASLVRQAGLAAMAKDQELRLSLLDHANDWLGRAIDEAKLGLSQTPEGGKTNWSRFLCESYLRRVTVMSQRPFADNDGERNRRIQVLRAQLKRARDADPDSLHVDLSALSIDQAEGLTANFARKLEALYQEAKSSPLTRHGRPEVIRAYYDRLRQQGKHEEVAEVFLEHFEEGLWDGDGPRGPSPRRLLEHGLAGAKSRHAAIQEAAKRALDEALRRNPGFHERELRAARAAVMFLSSST